MVVFCQPGDKRNAGSALIVAEVAKGLLRSPAMCPQMPGSSKICSFAGSHSTRPRRSYSASKLSSFTADSAGHSPLPVERTMLSTCSKARKWAAEASPSPAGTIPFIGPTFSSVARVLFRLSGPRVKGMRDARAGPLARGRVGGGSEVAGFGQVQT